MATGTNARTRSWGAAFAVAVATAAGAAAHAQPAGQLRVHVRGSSQIEAVAWSEPGAFEIRGTLLDDAGVPIREAPLTVQIVGGSGSSRDLPQAANCAPPARGALQGPRTSPDGYLIETDDRGGFCLRGRAPLTDAALRVRFAGSKLYEGSERRVQVEAPGVALSPVLLRFDPAVDEVDLDRESFPVAAVIQVDRRDPARSSAAGSTPREGLSIVLEDERGKRLGEAPTGGDGRARFEVRTADMAGPGQGELRARFDGSGALAKAIASQPIVRRAQVSLALAHPLDPGDAEDGVPIDVDVSSSHGPVEGGVVEALRGGESVGAAAVQGGRARVIAVFIAGREGRVPITLRYVPAAPWWRAGPELSVEVPVRGPGVWRQIVIGALVVAIAGWILGGWRRAPKPPARADGDIKPPVPSGRAGVQIVGPSEGASGWRGVVTDAHDGTPIEGASITIAAPTFEGTGVLARVITDHSGAFSVEVEHRADARLVVEAPLHSMHEQALPPPSRLGIMLVTRRRALLDRLVRWARRQGAPYEGPPEPTPGHVRRVAGRSQDRDVEQWAARIEEAAFGPEAVEEPIEKEIRTSEPRRAPRGAGA